MDAKILFSFIILFLFNQFVLASSQVLSKPKLYCIHPSYPCYYYTCTQVAIGLDLINTPAYKCSNGFIFDEINQRCSQSFPFKSCKEDEFSERIKVLNKIDEDYKNVEENILPNENRKDFLLRVLKTFGRNSQIHESLLPLSHNSSYKSETNKLNITYLTTNDNNSEHVLFHEDLTNSSSTNNTSVYQDQKYHESYKDNDAYAFIIVPVKVPKEKSLNAKKSKPEIVNVRKNHVDDRNLKSFQNMFQYKKVCYVTNWSQYRPNGGYFSPEMIDPFLCTHIIYAFAYIDNITLTVRTIEENDEEMYRKLNDLKYKNPKLKTMLGIGGWNMESDEFSNMVSEKKTRLVFIYHAMKFLRHFGFDGIDLDWEFPADRGGRVEDKQKFTIFVREFRQAINDEVLEPNKDKLIMSAAVAAGKERIDKGYEISQLSADLDFINLMTFDYHGSWDPKTGLNAPLYSHENETGNDAMLNQDWSVSYWISHGCPPYKLVLGVPAYGRTFTLKDEKENGIGAESNGSGIAGNFTKTRGFMSYYECCALRKTKDWTTVWLSQSKSHYMFNKNQWISYDDIKSFHLRTAYVVAKKLGGLFIWSLDMDDFSGKFCDMGSFPLIKNSMSLLMDYMPEFYSSNVNPAPKAEVKSVSSDRQSSNLIYFLKEDDETLFKTFDPTKQISKTNLNQNKIQKDLLLLLKQQPHKFLPYNLIENFNCTNKQNGIHRDPVNCEKFYICNNNTKSNNFNFDNQPINHEAELMKEFKCPPNTRFTMNGCFCQKNVDYDEDDDDVDFKTKCPRLNDTFCRKL